MYNALVQGCGPRTNNYNICIPYILKIIVSYVIDLLPPTFFYTSFNIIVLVVKESLGYRATPVFEIELEVQMKSYFKTRFALPRKKQPAGGNLINFRANAITTELP